MPDVPVSLRSAFLPRYRVERELGAGGMATVYLAHDVRHERDVAIKVLKRDLAALVGADRFVAEIRTTAHFRHPHILPLFDSGSADGLPFYVMPFVEGESLRQRLAREGRLPMPQAIAILRELADALAYAHASGVAHRDVKPDNVLLSGRHVFLADFGVARAVAAHVNHDQTVTGTGVVVGTPAYMAPEQLTGSPVDARSDIYAFGILAYELLTGTVPFGGARQDVVTAHLTEAPVPLTTRRSETPAPIASAVMRCLEKKPEQRWQRIDDLLPVLESPTTEQAGAAAPPRARMRRTRGLVVTGLIAAASLAAAYYVWSGRHTRDSLSVGRIVRITTEPGLELDPALSPDGRAIAYAAGIPGALRIYVRQIEDGRMVPLTGDAPATEQRWPQWSSDGSRIVFHAGTITQTRRAKAGSSTLFVVPAFGGIARRVAGVSADDGAISPAWSPGDRRIAFAGVRGVYVVSAANPETPVLIAAADEAHSPAWAPDGRRIAFVGQGVAFAFGEDSLGNVSTSALFAADVETRQVTRITTGDWLDISPVWMPDGRSLLFVSSRGGGRDVFRQRLDSAGQPRGEPERVSSGLNAHGISLAADGRLLAYSSYTQRANIWSVEIPEGRIASVREAQQVTSGSEKIEKLAVSWDGRWLAYDSDRNGQPDVWRVLLAGGTPEQVTRGPNNEFVNGWSPDGQEIVFHSMREGGQRDVMVVSADGTRIDPVAVSPAEEQHAAWGPDGNSIVFDLSLSNAPNQMYVSRRARRGAPWGAPQRLTTTSSADPKWSPDGRLIAFCSGSDLLVISPDGIGQRVVVSGSAGLPRPSYPIWSQDSQTIYYKAYDAQLQTSIWAVAAAGGPPRLLVTFDDPTRRSLRREFASDGRRFYFTIANEESDIWAMELIAK